MEEPVRVLADEGVRPLSRMPLHPPRGLVRQCGPLGLAQEVGGLPVPRVDQRGVHSEDDQAVVGGRFEGVEGEGILLVVDPLAVG